MRLIAGAGCYILDQAEERRSAAAHGWTAVIDFRVRRLIISKYGNGFVSVVVSILLLVVVVYKGCRVESD